jgi:hypothetical protein
MKYFYAKNYKHVDGRKFGGYLHGFNVERMFSS